MAFSQEERINLALKATFGVQGTWNEVPPNGFQWFQEEYAYKQWALNDDIIMESIPAAGTYALAQAAVVANPSLIQEVELKLSVIPGTNGRAWAAFKTYNNKDSGVNADWLQPQVFGRGYALRLFQDNGTHNDSIPTSGAPGTEIATDIGTWIPNYKMGFLILGDASTAPTMGWTSPLWVRVFRYIGPKGVTGTTAGVSLDDAYNNGNSITVDQGPLTLNSTAGYAALQITPVVSAPTQNLQEGQITIVGGIQYQYNATKNKWLSVSKEFPSFTGRFGCGNYLSSDKHAGLNTGFTVIRNATITGITGVVGWGTQNKTFQIMKNGNHTSLMTIVMVAGKVIDTSLNIDLNSGDTVQIYFEPGSQAYSPRVNLEISWRL